MDEANRFYQVYYRITKTIGYNFEGTEKLKNIIKDIQKGKYTKQVAEKLIEESRKELGGLYSGLVEGKTVCAGYSLILCEALNRIGIKALYVWGFSQDLDAGHAWNQVQIDGKWYNIDLTLDAQNIQLYGRYEEMLLSDEEFEETHSVFSKHRTKIAHECKTTFDYSKIKGIRVKLGMVYPDSTDSERTEK